MMVGALTIGQSPRTDITSEIRDILGSDVTLLEKGVLDGLDVSEICKLLPRQGEPFLVTRLRDGKEVRLAEKHVVGRLPRYVSDLEEEGCEILILLCTGEFPEIQSRKVLLRPDRVLLNTARCIAGCRRLGVLLPAEEQIPVLGRRWAGMYPDVVMEAVSPYTGSMGQVREKALKFKSANVDLIVLDCLGFNKKTKAIFREVTGKPVLLPRTLVARVAREIIEA
jgi:protein AroM